jgi:hypothetical protein
MRNASTIGAILLMSLGLTMPARANALPCEEEIEKGRQALDLENRNLLALELMTRDPRVQVLRNDFNYRLMIFTQAQAQCAQAVRDDAQRRAPAASYPGCQRDTDCKGNRICASGTCVNP